MVLLFLESVGTTELLLILVVALMIFGPRKLPELSRSLGKGLGEFKRASDEFKRTWEREVNFDHYERERQIGEAMLPPEESHAGGTSAGETIASPGATEAPAMIARGGVVDIDAPAQSSAPSRGSSDAAEAVAPAPQSPHKTDWL
jgi:TatA/E family protein of Tat protein translocase